MRVCLFMLGVCPTIDEFCVKNRGIVLRDRNTSQTISMTAEKNVTVEIEQVCVAFCQ